jgi:hypothetical protein
LHININAIACTLLVMLPCAVPTTAQPQEDPTQPHLQGSAGISGLGLYRAGTWGVVKAKAINPTDQHVKAMVLHEFVRWPKLKYGFEALLPPASRLDTWCPMAAGSVQLKQLERTVTVPIPEALTTPDPPVAKPLPNATNRRPSRRGLTVRVDIRKQVVVFYKPPQDGKQIEHRTPVVDLLMPTDPTMAQQITDKDYEVNDVTHTIAPGGLELVLHIREKPPRAFGTWSMLIERPDEIQRWSRQAGLLPVTYDPLSAAQYVDYEDDHEIDAAVALRLAHHHSKRIVPVRDLPFIPAAFESLDTFFFAKDLPKYDAAQAEATRQWLLRGGNLWIAIDQVDPDAMRALFHEDFTLHVADFVNVTDVRIADETQQTVYERKLEDPARFARVLAPNLKITHTLNGWPAAMRHPIGRGTVLITTLEPRAWLDKDGHAGEAFEQFGRVFNRPAKPSPLPRETFDASNNERIGFTIVGRGVVLAVLGGFGALVLITGVVLGCVNRLEHIGWGGAVLAVVATLVLVQVGIANRGSVPTTIATTQFIYVVPTQDTALIWGTCAMYSQTAQSGQMRSTTGGMMWPDLTGQADEGMHIVWTDLDKWQWEGFDLTSGTVQKAFFTHAIQLPKPVNATLRFVEQGALVQPNLGPWQQFDDVVIATAGGALAPTSHGGKFVAGRNETIVAKQYIRSATVTNPQKRHLQVYRQLLSQPPPQGVGRTAGQTKNDWPAAYFKQIAGTMKEPLPPLLLGWSTAADLGFQIDIEHDKREEAVVAIPLTVMHAAPGDKVHIPSPFVGFSTIRGRGGHHFSPIYDNLNNQWLSPSQGATVLMRFQLPEQVLPLKVSAVRLTIDIQAPKRTLEILELVGDQLNTVAAPQAATGKLVFDEELSTPDILKTDDRGGIVIGMKIHHVQGVQSVYQINGVWLDVDGVVQEDTR